MGPVAIASTRVTNSEPPILIVMISGASRQPDVLSMTSGGARVTPVAS
jgi:hypothetical protein